ncbi:MAG TPA: M20 family metallo-hydrolase [Clostridia bacterium]|nr:M20 family metallo-hydrolase [Clostridia bacterium]
MAYYEKKIVQGLDWISQYAIDPRGGLTRLVFTEPWLKTQNLILRTMKEKGFDAYFDEVGNVHIRLEGERKETLLIGSHIDTVIQGGKLDGQYGVLAGLLALEEVKNKFGKPKYSIEVISMSEEEGSRFPFNFWGSKNIVGAVDKNVVKELVDEEGITFLQALKKAGFGLKKEKEIKKHYKAYCELHIEQGGVLEDAGKKIGIVHTIVGQRRYEVYLKGEANHAGTTPMSLRRDALDGAARMVLGLKDLARKYGDPMVATVGQISLEPGSSNVIPAQVRFSIDIRHSKKDLLEKFDKQMKELFKDISEEEGLEHTIILNEKSLPVPLDNDLQELLEKLCTDKKISFMSMVSGAGHDAQNFAPYIPTALIFVPSIGGISHSPAEDTKLEDLVDGLRLLENFIYRWAYEDKR